MARQGNQDLSQNNFLAPSLNLDSEYSMHKNSKESILRNAFNATIESFNSEGYWITQETSNSLCFKFPDGYTYKGALKLDREEFVVFFVQADGVTSEVGIFNANHCNESLCDKCENGSENESNLNKKCVYKKWAESTCLGFDKVDYIDGVWKYDNIANGRTVYINDGVNPDRILQIDKCYPRKEVSKECGTETVYLEELDCEQLLPNQKIFYPCVDITHIPNSGLIPNGRYQVAIAGSDGVTSLTDYMLTNDVVVYSNANTNSLTIKVSNLNTEYEYVNIVLVSSLSTGQNAYSIGHFKATESTLNNFNTSFTVQVSTLSNYEPIAITKILERRPYYITSKFQVEFYDSLIKGDIKTRKPIYYQKQANKIKSEWVSTLVKEKESFKYPQHMRDEVYAYFIEWFYRDGEKTEAFHIPNNSIAYDNDDYFNFVSDNDDVDDLDCEENNKRHWELYDTASVSTTYIENIPNSTACTKECTELEYQKGEFGIYLSERTYPDFKELDSNNNPTSQFIYDDLACEQIKLHKFPSNNISPHYHKCTDCQTDDLLVSVLGIRFSNIEKPLDENGVEIPDIVGYRILRADRSNNESILSKGLFAHMWYDDDVSKAYYPTIGYGSVGENKFISTEQSSGSSVIGSEPGLSPVNFNTANDKKKLTYLSPETSYTAPRQASHIKVYNTQVACLQVDLNKVHQHPEHVILTGFTKILAMSGGALATALQINGSNCTTETLTESTTSSYFKNKVAGKEEGKTSNINLNLVGQVGQAGPGSSDYSSTIDATSESVGGKARDDSGEWKDCAECKNKITFSTLQVKANNVDSYTVILTLDKAYGEDITFTINKIYNNITTGLSLTVPAGQKEVVKHSYTDNFNPFTPNLIGIYIDDKNVVYDTNHSTGEAKCYCPPGANLSTTKSKTTTKNDCATIGKLLNKNQGLLGKLFNAIPGIPLIGEELEWLAIFIEKNLTPLMLGSETAGATYRALKEMIPSKQYAYQIDSVGYYSSQVNPKPIGEIHRRINRIEILQPAKVTVGNVRINNSYRVGHVFIDIFKPIKTTTEDNNNITIDNFLERLGDDDADNDKYSYDVADNIKGANHYGATYVINKAQYGDLVQNNLLPIGCINYNISEQSKVYYNGDTYITRFSLKNHFLLFEPTYIGKERNYELDYRNLNNIGYPTYWMDTSPSKMLDALNPLNLLDGTFLENTFRFYRFDGFKLNIGPTPPFVSLEDPLRVNGAIVMAINSVYSFLVESSYINTYRGISQIQAHYPFSGWSSRSDVNAINRSDKWPLDNQYIYDQSLRVTELHQNNKVHYNNVGYINNRDRFKVAYSERLTNEDTYDRWNVFKPLSYTQLSQQDGFITALTSYGGKLWFFFEDAVYHTTPSQSLMTNLGEEIYLGTGDLFSQKLQKIAYETTGLTGCLDRYSINSNRHGLSWVDRKRKKIFLYGKGLETISNDKCTQWFQFHIEDDLQLSKEEPIEMTNEQYNSFISVYDNHYDKMYFTHKRTDKDCSWTLSFKPGVGWQSFHPFKPTDYLHLPNNFLSVIDKNNSHHSLTENFKGIYTHNNFKPSHNHIYCTDHSDENELKYQVFYNTKHPYYFTYISAEGNSILQSLQIKHETTTEYGFDERKFHNNIFFNKINIYSEYSNSGDLTLVVKDPKNRLTQLRQTNTECVVSHIEQNQWRLNSFSNKAVCQPHHRLFCNGYTPETFNVNYQLNPRLSGTLRGDWFAITLWNDVVFNKRFKTFFSLNLIDKINV